MSAWHDKAYVAIYTAHSGMRHDVSFKDRKKRIDDAYPFGERKHFPYKAWLKERKAYLFKYDPKNAGPLFHD